MFDAGARVLVLARYPVGEVSPLGPRIRRDTESVGVEGYGHAERVFVTSTGNADGHRHAVSFDTSWIEKV